MHLGEIWPWRELAGQRTRAEITLKKISIWIIVWSNLCSNNCEILLAPKFTLNVLWWLTELSQDPELFHLGLSVCVVQSERLYMYFFSNLKTLRLNGIIQVPECVSLNGAAWWHYPHSPHPLNIETMVGSKETRSSFSQKIFRLKEIKACDVSHLFMVKLTYSKC